MAEVSICIPVYNRPLELDRALRSARGQTFADLEIVVLDNHSTDDTWRVARQHADEDARVRAVRTSAELPRAASWRRCAELASSPYIKLLFSDDWISPRAVERALAALRAHPDAAFAYSAMTRHHRTPATLYRERADGPYRALDFLARSAAVEDLVPVTASCALLRTADVREALVERIGTRLPYDFDAYGLGCEAMVLWRCADRYRFVYHLTEDLAHSADAQSGQADTVTQVDQDGQRMLWWAYRNAFARFLSLSVRPLHERRALQAVLLLSCVPLRTGRMREQLDLYTQLFPEPVRWWAVAPLSRSALPVLIRRLIHPLDVDAAI
jgi:glycosyltransferase involved in cell wall biosynthesis